MEDRLVSRVHMPAADRHSNPLNLQVRGAAAARWCLHPHAPHHSMESVHQLHVQTACVRRSLQVSFSAADQGQSLVVRYQLIGYDDDEVVTAHYGRIQR